MREFQIRSQSVQVRDIRVEAFIGVYAHEKQNRQLLNISVELIIDPPVGDDLCETVDYKLVVDECLQLANTGTSLIEIFARRLATSLLARPLVREVNVVVEKPSALANGFAGTSICMMKD